MAQKKGRTGRSSSERKTAKTAAKKRGAAKKKAVKKRSARASTTSSKRASKSSSTSKIAKKKSVKKKSVKKKSSTKKAVKRQASSPLSRSGSITSAAGQPSSQESEQGHALSSEFKGLVSKIRREVEGALQGASNLDQENLAARQNLQSALTEFKEKRSKPPQQFEFTGVTGFDQLLTEGVPKGSAVLLAGGAGSGKTIFGLQVMAHHAARGKKCLYMSFEESEEHLIHHMEDFGWNPRELMKKKKLMIKRFNPFDITRSVDALLMKAKGELLIDVKPIILPEGFVPDFLVVDSLTAIASAFAGREESYRIYIEQLFRFFEQLRTTSFLITETQQMPTIFSPTGVEEFLADGVVVFYNLRKGNIKESAIEILKLRGTKHEKKIVAFQITSQGIQVYPDQQIFAEM